MYFCGIAQILPVRHETPINQSIICPPNVDSTMVDFGRYPIHIGMQCIAVCHVERHQKLQYVFITMYALRLTCSNAYEQYT